MYVLATIDLPKAAVGREGRGAFCTNANYRMLGAASAPAAFSLSTATLRNLGHKEYEKRKQAALEVRAPLPRTALRQPS